MLEMFFDNEKVFSVFEQILKQESDEIWYPKICFDLGISPSVAAEILQSFLFLDILEEKEDSLEDGVFLFNRDSVVVLGLCIFDDIVGKYSMKKMSDGLDKIMDDIANNGEEGNIGNFDEIFKDILGDGSL